jgi:peptidase M23-like protein
MFKVQGFWLLEIRQVVYRSWVFFVLTVFSTHLKGQTAFPKDYFTPPLFLPLNLAGNFGEIRSNHFHSGIDIKTNEQEGQVVMAAADGYVSRIKVSAVGFGNAIYINHPNGFTTVYGHLQRFNYSIHSYVEAEQYKMESFEVDLFPDSGLFPVKQGQLIALSGNTGGSEGPHLHFETRNAVSEHPINPLLFGFHSEDTIAPVIKNIKIYQLHDTRYGFITDTTFNLAVNDSSHAVAAKEDTVFISEKTAFSVETSDKMNDTSSNLVINNIELLLDGKTIYTYHFDEFSFEETRFVNANIDYAEKITENKKYILLYRLPGNNFSMFDTDTTMTGMFHLTDTVFHSVEIKASDFNGNVCFQKLKVKMKVKAKKKILKEPFVSWEKTPVIKKHGIKISFAKNAVYNMYPLDLTQEKKIKGTYSPVFTIGDETIPIHTFMNLSLKPSGLSAKLFSKALIVSISKKGYLSPENGNYSDGWITAKTKHFGKFAIAIDTIAPLIKEPEIYTDSTLDKRILFTIISDNLSGIRNYKATLNGKWLLMEYDEKTGRLSSELNKTMEGNKTELEIEVTDMKENKRSLKKMIDL